MVNERFVVVFPIKTQENFEMRGELKNLFFRQGCSTLAPIALQSLSNLSPIGGIFQRLDLGISNTFSG